MNDNDPYHKFFMDQDLCLVSFGNKSNGFYGIINFIMGNTQSNGLIKKELNNILNGLKPTQFTNIQNQMSKLHRI